MTRPPLLSTPRSFLFTAGANEPVYGIRMGFKTITGNEPVKDVSTQPQYFLDVVDICTRRVMFIFSNRELDNSAITDIYFNDKELFAISVHVKPEMVTGENLSCSEADLTANQHCASEPYRDSTSFQFIRWFPGDADFDAAHSGINQNESLGIVFDLQAGVTLTDIINALSKEVLNIGIRVWDDSLGISRILINEPTLNLSPYLHQQKIA